jgi:sulfatase maturation enzyme AslB (radical SAM superfamily)
MHYDLFKEKLLEAGLNKEKFISMTSTTETTYNNWAKRSTYETAYWVEAYLDIYIKNRENEIYIAKLKKDFLNHD